MAARKSAAKKSSTRKAAGRKAAAKKGVPKRGAKPAPKRVAKRAAKPARPARKKQGAAPQGYNTITAYLCVDGAADAIDFYKRAFGAQERLRRDAPQGRVGHAELVIGDSAIMLADEFPEMEFLAPKKGERPSVNMHVYVADVDEVVANALDAGAKLLRAIEDKFYGDRSGTIEDPFGHVWHLATHVEDLSPEEMKRRGEEAGKDEGA